MKVTFVHLGRENLGIEYLSAVLKRHGHQICLAYDPGLFGLSDNVLYIPPLERLFARKEALVDQIVRDAPDLVGFSAYTGTYQWCLSVAREVKARLDVPVVFGGIHPTLVPEEVIGQQEVDYVVVGEAEEAFPELLERVQMGRPPKAVANVWFREDGKIVSQPVRSPIKDLDQLPLPDKALFQEEVNYSDDYMILAARGCPFRCTYCCEGHWNHLYNGKYFRRRGVDPVMQELGVMKGRYGFREVMFNDPIFFTDRVWLRRLMERYREEIKTPFRCFGKAGFLDQEVAETLKWGGCYAIEFGLQTFNPQIRKGVLGRPEGNEEYRKAFSVLDRVGIRYDIDHMFGLPGERPEDHVEAAKFYMGLGQLNRIKCHNLTYFPGLRIVERAQEEGILSREDQGRIVRGEMISDFFHVDSIRDQELKEAARAFQSLFKVLPVLPRRILEKALEEGRWRSWKRVPGPLIILGQVLAAIRGRDYRFFLYLRYYFLRVRRSLQVLPRLRALIIAALWGAVAAATIPVGNRLLDAGAFHVLGIFMAGVGMGFAWRAMRGAKKG